MKKNITKIIRALFILSAVFILLIFIIPFYQVRVYKEKYSTGINKQYLLDDVEIKYYLLPNESKYENTFAKYSKTEFFSFIDGFDVNIEQKDEKYKELTIHSISIRNAIKKLVDFNPENPVVLLFEKQKIEYWGVQQEEPTYTKARYINKRLNIKKFNPEYDKDKSLFFDFDISAESDSGIIRHKSVIELKPETYDKKAWKNFFWSKYFGISI